MNVSDVEILIKGTLDSIVQWRKSQGYPKPEFTAYEWDGKTIWYQSATQMILLQNNKPIDLTPELKKALKILVKAIKQVEAQKKKAKSIVKVPFRDGNQLHYPERRYTSKGFVEPEWVENFEFEDELEITGIQRGRSAAYFTLRSVTTGKEYTMFMKDLMGFLQGTKLKAKWTFQKRGANFGIRKVKDNEKKSVR